MTSVRAHGVGFAYAGAEPVFAGADFHLAPGWTGLVGANGAGKSTLLRLLAGELEPTEGHLRVEPVGARVHLCPQRVEELGEDIVALAEGREAVGRRLLGQLGLDPGEVERWGTLSPGERKRWQLGAALAAEPQVLLLDEPTNHLDSAGRAWLVGALRRFRGVGVVVSHDRELLEALTERTLRVYGGAVEEWAGGYGQARAAWEAERRGRQEAREQAREQQRRLHQRLVQTRREQEAASAARSVGRRMKDKHDSDARTMGAQNLVSWAEARHGRRVAVARRELEQAQGQVESLAVEKELGRSVFVDWERPPVAQLFTLERDSLRAGEVELAGELRLVVGRGDRVHVAGANGAGKSTLLRALMEGLRVAPERVLYLPQELTAEEAREAVEEVRELPPEERGRVLSLVAALGVEPDRLLATSEPSPGEARKLLMARGLGQHAWALVLDEPTNHLDLPSIERLEAALREYPGALVLVTHDEALARACTSTRWRLGGRRLEVESVG